MLTPLDTGGSITWACTGSAVIGSYLPSSCEVASSLESPEINSLLLETDVDASSLKLLDAATMTTFDVSPIEGTITIGKAKTTNSAWQPVDLEPEGDEEAAAKAVGDDVVLLPAMSLKRFLKRVEHKMNKDPDCRIGCWKGNKYVYVCSADISDCDSSNPCNPNYIGEDTSCQFD